MGKLMYFADPMCSWCYGFAPEISKVKLHFQDKLEFHLVMGGLRPFGKETMVHIAEFLRHHWDDVNQRSGQAFRYEILKETDMVYDTEPPSRAVVVMQELKPLSAFAFFEDVQKAFYFENRNMGNLATYTNLAKKYNVKASVFGQSFQDEEIKQKTLERFTYARHLGVSVFPTTVLENNDRLHLLARGYMEAELIIERADKLLNS